MRNVLKKVSVLIFAVILTFGITSTVYCGTLTDSSQLVITKAQSEYTNIPLNIRQKFEASGWKIIYTDNNTIATLYKIDTGITIPTGSYITGITRTSDATIYINTNIIGNGSTISHEMGHWIDISVGHAYINSQEWQQIFLEEGKNFTEYGSSNKNEFFGEICSEVMQGRVVTACPKASEYIKMIISSIT